MWICSVEALPPERNVTLPMRDRGLIGFRKIGTASSDSEEPLSVIKRILPVLGSGETFF